MYMCMPWHTWIVCVYHVHVCTMAHLDFVCVCVWRGSVPVHVCTMTHLDCVCVSSTCVYHGRLGSQSIIHTQELALSFYHLRSNSGFHSWQQKLLPSELSL